MKNPTIRLQKVFKTNSIEKVIKNLAKRYWEIQHNRKSLQFYSRFIHKGDICFDVGANNGNRTKLFLKLGAKTVCVEPQQVCLQQLKKLFGNNKNVIIVSKALADKEGTATIDLCEDAPILSTMSDKWKNEGRFSKEYKWTATQEVATTTLDALIEQYGLPSFCKIDVEGFEESVLKGLSKPINVISFEFTKEFLQDANKCINHISLLGPAKFNCSIGESMKLVYQTWVTPEELYMKLESLDDKDLWGDIYARFT
jgi:FkbM family methyltransferase